MPLLHIVILALIQGITEFLPISSSGHLVLAHGLMNEGGASSWDEDFMIDIAMHIGTMLAAVIFFRADVLAMICGLCDILRGRFQTPGARLGLFVLAASVPVIIAGFALHLWQPGWLRSIEIVGWMTLIFGVVLWWADEKHTDTKTVEAMTLRDALIIGASQILALIPGVSRSGITMTAARTLGFSRTQAARFSLLLALIAISGAGILSGYHLSKSGDAQLGMDALLAGVLSFFAAWLTIVLMMRWLQNATFRPFAIYRVVLGALLLGLVYTGYLPRMF